MSSITVKSSNNRLPEFEDGMNFPAQCTLPYLT
jgi:hypothetical protein